MALLWAILRQARGSVGAAGAHQLTPTPASNEISAATTRRRLAPSHACLRPAGRHPLRHHPPGHLGLRTRAHSPSGRSALVGSRHCWQRVQGEALSLAGRRDELHEGQMFHCPCKCSNLSALTTLANPIAASVSRVLLDVLPACGRTVVVSESLDELDPICVVKLEAIGAVGGRNG
jgi:hypothetical protein